MFRLIYTRTNDALELWLRFWRTLFWFSINIGKQRDLDEYFVQYLCHIVLKCYLVYQKRFFFMD